MSLYFLLMCIGFVFPVAFIAAAQELPDAQTWEQLKSYSSSMSITSVADNCQKTIEDARNSCKASIDHASQLILQTKDNTSVKGLIQETIEEVSSILQSVSSNVYGQLLETGNRFQKRLEQIVNANNSIQPAIVEELQGVLQPPTDCTDQIIINARQLFSPAYNPSPRLKEAVANKLEKILITLESELNQLQETTIYVLNSYNRGTAAAKDIQTSLKKSGTLPRRWTSHNLKIILLSSMQITNTLQSIEKVVPQSNLPQTEKLTTQELTLQKQKTSSTKVQQIVDDDFSLLLQEEIELDEDDNESGCGQIFERAKKKLRTKLVSTVKDIRKATDAKTLDTYTDDALKNYSELLDDVSYKMDTKLVDFSHQFIKLYTTVLGIMEKINEGMKNKLVEIFKDQNTDPTDFYYNNIRKYFTGTYFTEEKMKELYQTAASSMKTAKTTRELQKQIIKQLSLVTSDLVRDMDTMKSTTVYILLEMRKGVIALQNLKNKSNITGIRKWFNYYDGKADCAQVKKLIYIINAININQLFEQQIQRIQISSNTSQCETITEMIQKALSDKTTYTLKELDQKTSLHDVDSIRSQFLQTYNTIMTVYKLQVRKVIKKVVVKFINVYEEALIIMKRENIKEVELLDTILDNETSNIGSESPMFGMYLARNTEVSVQQDTGISFKHKFKNIKEAKYTMKSSINQIFQVLNNQIIEMKTEIQKIMGTITEEAKSLHQAQKSIQTNKNFNINETEISNLQYLMRVANTLSISHGDISNDNVDLNSSNQQLESYISNSIERLRTEKQNAQIEIEKCIEAKQLQAQVIMTTTRIREIISDTVMEMKTDINQYTAQYKAALDTYVKLTNHETLLKVLERAKNDENIKISLSKHLQTYLQDKYSNAVLENLKTSTKSKNIEENKKLVVEALNLTIKQIETDMGSAKLEAMNTIFDTFKQSIDILEAINGSETKQRLDEEKIKTLTLLSRLQSILSENVAIKANDSIEEARKSIVTAKQYLKDEYSRSAKVLTSLTNKLAIQTEIENAVDLFDSIYNTMRQSIKTKMETLSIEFYETFKKVSAKTTKTKIIIQEIMSGIYNKEFLQREDYQKFWTVVNSEIYTSSLAVNSMYEKIQRDQKVDVHNKAILLENLNEEIISNINKVEEVVKLISHTFEESTNIITSINKGKQLDITDTNEVSILTQSLLIYQTLLQIQNRVDFTSVQKIISQEYEQAVQTITSSNDETIINEVVLKSIEKYDTVTNLIENEVAQKFMKISSDFTNKYEIVMQIVTAEGDEELLSILQNIVEHKMSDIVSNNYKKLESYINSSSFRSTTFAKDLYQNKLHQQEYSSKDISLEQLKLLTFEVEDYIQEMDIESQFANEHFLKGARILQSMQTGNFKLNEEQIQIITECTMITQIIFRQNLSNIHSTNDDGWEASSTAKQSINEEYNHAVEIIKSTKERVIIEQTIITTVYKYDDIYNNLREEMKQIFSSLQIDFVSTYDTIMEILQVQNVPMYNRLQKIQNKPNNYTSIKYTKFESYIKSEKFTSYSLIKNEFSKLEDTKPANIDQSIEQLTYLSKIGGKEIEKMDQIKTYILEILHRSIEILLSTESDVNVQLNEEQLSTLYEAFKVSKIIEAVILCEERMEEKFLTAERNINDVFENAVNEIQGDTIDERIQQVISTNIQNYSNTYNTLKEEVKEMLNHKSTFFINTFNAISKSLLLEKSEISTSIVQIKKKKLNTYSQKYETFKTYITSDKFSLSSYIAYTYQNIELQDILALPNKQKNTERLTIFTNEVKQSITEMNEIFQLTSKYFQENIEYLRTIQNTSKLTQEGIITLTECINISDIVSFICVKGSSENDIMFETAETTINKEYEKTIKLIKNSKEEVELQQIINTSIHQYEETYNVLRSQVKETLTQTSMKFSSSYTKVLDNLILQKKTELVSFIENIRSTKKISTFIENYSKCEAYLNSDSFKSSFWVQECYDRSIGKYNYNEVSKENHIKEIRTITTEVNHQITQARDTSKYIIQLFEQSIDIFKLIENDFSDEQLSQEQCNLLAESMIFSEQISYKFSTKSQQEETMYTTTQNNIRNIYQNAVTTIKEEKTSKESLLNIVQSYEDVYNNYKSDVKRVFTQTILEFSQSYDSIMKNVIRGNGNTALQTLLQDIKSKRVNIQISNEYNCFESYISNKEFFSTNAIKKTYNKMEKQEQQSSKNGINELRSLTKEVNILVDKLNNARQFVSETIQKSSNILTAIETNSSIQLTQDQITLLTESILITEIISMQSINQEEEKMFTLADANIEEEWKNAVNEIKTSKDIVEVQTTVTRTVKSYDKTYNQVRDELKQIFIETSTKFTETFSTTLKIFETQKNTKAENLLRDIQYKKISTNVSEQYRNFEAYVSSNNFTTVLLATHLYQNIQQKSSSNDISEEHIKNLESITKNIQEHIYEMSTVQTYVSQTLQRSTNILKYLESNTNIKELTKEEIILITESILISETIVSEFNSKTLQNEEIFATAEINIEQQHEDALHKISSATDIETINEAILQSTETYDTTIKSLKEEVKHIFTETTTEFNNIYNEVLDSTSSHKNEAVRTILEEIRDHKVEVQVSEEYQIFESFVSSETFSSSVSISESYNEIQEEELVTDTGISINDRGINKLEKLTTKVNKCISQTNRVRKYVTQIFQKSTRILKIVTEVETIELTIEQTSILNESILISEKLSQSNVTNEKVESISQAEIKVNKEYTNALETIKSITNEKEAHQALAVVMNHYETIYRETFNEVQCNTQNFQKNYLNKLEQTMKTLSKESQNAEIGTALQKIIHNEAKTTVEADKGYQTFKSYINSDLQNNSLRSIQLHEDLARDTNNSYDQTKVKENSIQQLSTVTEQVNEKLNKLKFVNKYVSENYEKSNEILEKVSQCTKQELTTEEIHILTITKEIMRTFEYQSTNQEDITINTINQECENAINLIQELETEEEIVQEVNKNIQNYNKVYGNVQEGLKTKLTETSTEFKKKFESNFQTLNTDKNVLQKIENSKQQVLNEEEMKQFKLYIEKNQSFSSKVEKTYENISKKDNKLEDIKLQSTQELENLSKDISQKIVEINKCEKYVAEQITQGEEVLQAISENKNIILNEEQISTLTRSIVITETINKYINVKHLEENEKGEGITQPTATRDIHSKAIENQEVMNQEVIEESTKTYIQNLTSIQETINEESSATINMIRATEDEEKVKELVEEHKQTLQKSYSNAQQNTTTQITQTSSNFITHLQSTLNEMQNVESSNILNKAVNEGTHYEKGTDQELEKYLSKVKSGTFSSDSIPASTHQIESTKNLKEETIHEIEYVTKEVSQNLQIMKETSEFVSENIEKSNNILKKVEKEREVELNEEEVEQITKSVKIIRALQESEVITLDSTSNNLDGLSISPPNVEIQKEIEKSDKITSEVEFSEKEIGQVAKSEKITTTSQDSDIMKMDNKCISNNSVTLDSKQKEKEVDLAEEEVKQTTTDTQELNMKNVLNNLGIPYSKETEEEKEVEEEKKVIEEEKEKEIEEDKLGEKEIKQDKKITTALQESNRPNMEISNTSISNNLGAEVKQMTESEKITTSSKKSTTKMDNIYATNNQQTLSSKEIEMENKVSKEEVKKTSESSQITMASQELMDSRHVSDNLSLMNKEIENESTSIKTTTTASQESKVMKSNNAPNNLEDSLLIEKNNESITTETHNFESYQSSAKVEKQDLREEIPISEEQSTSVTDNQTVDFIAIQNTMEEENNIAIDSIKLTEDEDEVKTIMKEHIQTLDKTYKDAQQNTENEIVQTSTNFVHTFQSTVSHVQNTEVQTTLNNIMNENVQYPEENDEELQKFESYIKSEAFSSTFTATHVLQNIEEQTEHDTDMKEKSIHEIEAVGAKINENLHTMEETTKFVSENLEKSTNILKKIETDKEIQLDEEEVNQIARSMKITKVLYESETINCDSSHTSRSIDVGTDTDTTTVMKESTSTHTETKKETNQRNYEFTTIDNSNKDALTTDIKNVMEDNCLSISPQKCNMDKTRTQEKISISVLLANWKVTESEDKRWPSECRNLSWSSEKFANPAENKVFAEEMSQILKISRNLIENTIHMELKKLKLNRRIREDLSTTTVCVENVHNILQRLSTFVSEEMERFSSIVGTQIKNSKFDVEKKLEAVSTTLDEEFMAVNRAFLELQFCEKSDMLEIIDEQYANEVCDTVDKSKKVTKEKLQKLQSTTNTILDNIDCLVLTMFDTFVNGKITIQNLTTVGNEEISLDSLKNSQILHEILVDL